MEILGEVQNEAFSHDSCNESRVVREEGTVSIKQHELEMLARNIC